MQRHISKLSDAYLEFHNPIAVNKETGITCRVVGTSDGFIHLERNGVTFVADRRDDNYVVEC